MAEASRYPHTVPTTWSPVTALSAKMPRRINGEAEEHHVKAVIDDRPQNSIVLPDRNELKPAGRDDHHRHGQRHHPLPAAGEDHYEGREQGQGGEHMAGEGGRVLRGVHDEDADQGEEQEQMLVSLQPSHAPAATWAC
jgi:hypothetical protein